MIASKKCEFYFDDKFNSQCYSFKDDYPKAVFLNISSWLTPTNEDDTIDYHSINKKLRKNIKQTIFNNLNRDIFDPEKTIVDLNLKDSGIKYNKKSYIECEITFIVKRNKTYYFDDLKQETSRMNDIIISDSLLSNPYFEYTREK